MADWQTIANAKARSMVLEQYLGVKPEMAIYENHVRLYYTPDKLARAQDNFITKMEEPPGKVRVEMGQVFVPWAVNKMSLPLFGLFAFGLLLGRKFK